MSEPNEAAGIKPLAVLTDANRESQQAVQTFIAQAILLACNGDHQAAVAMCDGIKGLIEDACPASLDISASMSEIFISPANDK